jgi:DNA recombination protein RmuC
MIGSIPVLILAALVGLALGSLVAWIVVSRRMSGLKAVSDADKINWENRVAELRAQLSFAENTLGVLRSENSTQKAEIAVLTAQLQAEKGKVLEIKAGLDDAENKLKEAFGSLAAKALADNNQAFLAFARQELGSQQLKASHELEMKETAISDLLKPVNETLARLASHTQDLEMKRTAAYSGVEKMIEAIQTTHLELRKETGMLVSALRAPKTRGNWGELQLKKCVEFAGMVDRCSFREQVNVQEEGRTLQPDMVISLPNGRVIVVDAKTPFDAFLQAMATEDEDLKRAKLAEHALAVRQRMQELQKKAYWKQFSESPDLVICFLPSEVLFSAALEADPGLIEFSSQTRVFLAAPTTLIPLLKSIAYGWDQKKITENAEAIQETGRALYKKLTGAHAYLCAVGESLRKAGTAYDSLLGSLDGRGGFLSLGRKLESMKLDEQELKSPQPLQYTQRETEVDLWRSDEESPPLLTLTAPSVDQEPESIPSGN